jgi:hypothetical protein
MALNNNDSNILEQIVQLEGKCMESQRCKLCPFRVMCLPEFINPNPPSPEQRMKMSLDVLAHHALVDDLPLEVTEYKWDKK